MAIQQIKIEGYRSLKDVTWTPGKLNLLVGPNGSGKSNVLRCLELISQTAQGRLQQAVAEAGGIIPLLWDHRAGKAGWKLRIDPVDPRPDRLEDALTYSLKMEGTGSSAYQIIEDSLGNWQAYERGEVQSPYWIFARTADRAYIYDMHQQAFASQSEVPGGNGPYTIEPESPHHPEGFDLNESLLATISGFHNVIPVFSRRELEAWRICHDVNVARGAPMRSSATTQVTRKLKPDGSNLAPFLHTLYDGNREFRAQIDEGMCAGFGAEYDKLTFTPAAAQQIQLGVLWKSSSDPHTAPELSDGTLRYLFLLAVLADPDPPSVIAIDEPETGLHPSMLPVIAEYAEVASQHTQVILTTHSPEFLDAFSEMAPNVTVCQWEEGETSLHAVDEDALAKWLEHYRLGDMFTRGELDLLAGPPLEPHPDFDQRFAGFPPESEVAETAGQ